MKNSLFYAYLLFLIILSHPVMSQQNTDPEENYSKIELPLTQRDNLLHELASQGLAVDHFLKTGPNTIELILSESELQVLQSNSVQYEVLVQDMAAHYGHILQSSPEHTGADCGLLHFDEGSMGGYHTFDEVVAHINAMQAEFPDIVQVSEPGASIEERPVIAVKISDNVETDESGEEGVVYFDALHHAREPISMESVLYYMWWLLENYGSDPEATYLVNHRELYFVPVVNPDGYVYNQQTNPNGGGFWRKNRRDAGNGCFGVDLNRNYSFGWGLNTGSSSNPCTETYRGTEPFSEPEIQAVRNLLSGIDPAIAFSCHTFGDKFLGPFGYTDSLATYEVYAEYASEFIPPTYAGYGTTAKMLGYTSSGTTRDYLHTEGTYAWTPEIGHSFWEPASVICDRVQEFMPTMKYLSWVSGNFACYHNFESLNEQIWQGDTIRLNIRLKNRGLALPSSNVAVTLESLQSGIIPINNSINYGDIAPRVFKDNGGEPFTFYVQGEVEVGEPLGFELVVTQDGQESYRDGIVLTAGLRTVLFSDDFESGAQHWATSNPSAWDTTFMDSQGGFHSLADSRYGNYLPNELSTVFLQEQVDLSNAGYPQLEFNAKWALEEDRDFVVLRADAGNGPEPLEGLFTTFSGGQPRYVFNRHWVQEFVSLSDYIGQPGVSFSFRLQADFIVHSDGFYVDDFQVVDYSEPAMVSTKDGGKAAVRLSVFPNPAKGRMNLSADSQLAGTARMSLLSASGQLLRRQELTLAQGINRFTLGLSTLAPGLYWLKLSTAAGVQALQFVVL